MTTDHTAFDAWLHQVRAADIDTAAYADERDLRLAFDLGFTAREAYLWHLRAPEPPDSDVYLDA